MYKITTAVKVHSIIWAILLLWVSSGIIPIVTLLGKENPNKVKHSYEATMIDAYDYSYSTGKYSSAVDSKGRFLFEVDGVQKQIDQTIDGFVFKNFVKNGEKPFQTWIAVSGEQLGKPDPTWYDVMFAWLFVSGLGLFAMLFFCMYMAMQVDDRLAYSWIWEKK
ncbi:hypothetical protein D3C79_634340 [compost metagenome]